MVEVKVTQGNILECGADTLIVHAFEGESRLEPAALAVDQALNGAISDLIINGDLTGKAGEVRMLYSHGMIQARRVLVVGLGERGMLDLEAVRRGAAAAAQRGRELNAKHVASVLYGTGMGGITALEAAQAIVEGTMLALYQFNELKSVLEKGNEIQSFSLIGVESNPLKEMEEGARLALALVSGVYLTRDLVNLPPSMATPTRLAQEAEDIAGKYKMKITIGDREWAAQQGMGAFLGVAKGAAEPPRFIILEHNDGRQDPDTIVLVGKGITFDSGGVSLKPAEKMEEMKSDMAGAAAVLGAMKVVGELNLPLHVVGIAPCTENMPDGSAYHPADVLKASNGKTIEIISTDAEGRLILADALVYAQKFTPKAVIDLATLTGACVVALGSGIAAGIFSNDVALQAKLIQSGKATHERVWPLPLWDDYKKAIQSKVADIKNSGGRYGGVGTSAIFLKEFTNYPWAHLDIAGMALTEKEDGYIPAGATGYGVRLIINFLQQW